MKKIIYLLTVATFISFNACSGEHKEGATTVQSETTAQQQQPAATNGKKIIVDVRTPEEWNEGHADCSVNIPIDEFQNHIEELKQYEEVVLVCRSGGRAGRALAQMNSAGYNKASNLGPWTNVHCE